jgi:hypothetical protein
MLLRIVEFLAITQRGDGSALDELEFILDQTPSMSWGPEVGFAPPAQLGEPHNGANRDDSEQFRLEGLTQLISMLRVGRRQDTEIQTGSNSAPASLPACAIISSQLLASC